MKQTLPIAVPLISLCLGLSSCADFNQPTGHDPRFGLAKGNTKVTVCHQGKTITVAAPALAAHFAHGDGIAPPSGLVSWWPGDGNPNDIVDGNDGTLQNGATFAAGKVDQAFSLDGVDDKLTVADAANLDLAGDFSIDMWAKPKAFTPGPGFDFLITKNDGFLSETANFQVTMSPTGVMRFIIGGGAGTGLFQFIDAPSAIPLNQWSHIAVVRSSTSLELYINGVKVTSASRTVSQTTNNNPVVFGAATISGAEFNGLIDEVEIFNRALSPEEIEDIFDAGSAGKCKL